MILIIWVVLSTEAVVQGAKGAVAAEAPRPVHWVCSTREILCMKGDANGYRFGLVATMLEMIPVASIFFTYTNTGRFSDGRRTAQQGPILTSFRTLVGAALWAADIEAASTSMQPETAPKLRDLADKAEL